MNAVPKTNPTQNAERSRGEFGRAAEAYRRALAGRFDAELTGQLAQVLLEDGKVEEAGRLLSAALPLAPQHVGLRFLTAFLHDGRTDDLEMAIRLHGGEAEASVQAFSSLSIDDRTSLLDFVSSL